MKSATLKKLVTKLLEKEPIETGCKFHGDLAPAQLVVEMDDDSTITLDNGKEGNSAMKFEDDCIVLTSQNSFAGISEIYYPADRVRKATLKYGEERS